MDTRAHIIQIPRRFVTDEWGGSETFVAETSSRLNARGYHSEIFTTQALCTTPEEEYAGIHIRRFSYFYPYLGLSRAARLQLDKKAGNLFSLSLMRALAREKDVSLIHLHTGKRLGGIARRYARKRGIPYVISLHGGKLAVPEDEQGTWTEPTKGTLEWGRLLGLWVGSRHVLDDAAAIICVGKDEYEAIRSAYPHKLVEYLPNGVDVERFSHGSGREFRTRHSIPDDRFLCLTTARIDPQKHQLGLVRQLPSLIGTVPNIHLLFIGAVTNKQYADQVLQEADTLGVRDRVTLVPGIPYRDTALTDAYHAADCFVLPSLHEPFGMVVLEAWAAGLPVAASRRGGLPYIIKEGETGLLFDPETAAGDEDSIAAAISRLATREELRSSLAEAGKRTAQESYSWDSITDRLEDVYRRVHEGTLR